MRGDSRRGSGVNACKTLVGPKNTRSATLLIAASRFELPLLGSNQDSPDPESGVLPVTPRGIVYGAEGARTPDLLGAIQALSQLSYSPEGELKLNSPGGWFKRISSISIRQISRRQQMRFLTVFTFLGSAGLPLTAQEPWTANVPRRGFALDFLRPAFRGRWNVAHQLRRIPVRARPDGRQDGDPIRAAVRPWVE